MRTTRRSVRVSSDCARLRTSTQTQKAYRCGQRSTRELAGAMPVWWILERWSGVVKSRTRHVCYRTWLGVGAATLQVACAHVPAPAPHARAPLWFLPSLPCTVPIGTALPPARATDTLSASYAEVRIDAAHAYAARQTPGGYLSGPTPIAPTGRASLWLRDSTARDAVLSALPQMPGLALSTGIAAESIDVRHATWDSAALYDWLHYIMDRPDRPPGVNAYGIDVRGHLMLGLISADSVPALLATLERLGVPCGLVTLSVWGPISVS